MTGYVTTAERPPDPADYPDADPDLLVPGSLVFRKAPGPVDLRDVRNWWAYLPGASWRQPDGPGSDLSRRDKHPVTHVACADALAYAAWAGKDLPAEAEWEYAARGGLDGAVFAWGNEFAPGGEAMANTWQGPVPVAEPAAGRIRGHVSGGRVPAERLRPARHDRQRVGMDVRPVPATAPPGCRLGRQALRHSARGTGRRHPPPRHQGRLASVRYRPAARQGEAVDTSTSHIGFRCVQRAHAGITR